MGWWQTVVDAVTPKSAAEKEVDAMGFIQPGSPEPTAQLQLSYWDSLKESVVPVSYGENLVNQIYGAGANPATPPPEYDPADLSSPNVYIHVRDSASKIIASAVSTTKGMFVKLGIVAVAAILIVVVVHGIAGRR